MSLLRVYGVFVEIIQINRCFLVEYVLKRAFLFLFFSMNNIIAVDKDKFYITQFMYFRDFAKFYLEVLAYPFNWKWDAMMFYDGTKVKIVADNLFGANGINISPDKSYVNELWQEKHMVNLCDLSHKIIDFTSILDWYQS